MRHFQIEVGPDALKIYTHFADHGWALFNNKNGELILVVHGDPDGTIHSVGHVAKLFFKKFGKPLEPAGVICCYPKTVRRKLTAAGSPFASKIIGDWDKPTLIGVESRDSMAIKFEPAEESMLWLINEIKRRAKRFSENKEEK